MYNEKDGCLYLQYLALNLIIKLLNKHSLNIYYVFNYVPELEETLKIICSRLLIL